MWKYTLTKIWQRKRVATQVKSKKTKASVLAKLQLEDEMVEEDNPDELMKGNT